VTEDADAAEPDYRFTLANERTFLAWQRTALGLLAAAVALGQFMPEPTVPELRYALVGLVGLLAFMTAAAGLYRWNRVDHAIRRDLPLPKSSTPSLLTAGLLVVGILAIVVALTTTGTAR
jgi:putative membrane protein